MNGAMTSLPWLTILIAVPLIAGAIALFLSDNGARWLALIATIVDLDLGLYLWANYDPGGPQWQFVENATRSPACSAGRSASTASRWCSSCCRCS